MKKQLWKFAVAASLGVLLVSGCSAGTETSPAGSSSVPASSSAAPASSSGAPSSSVAQGAPVLATGASALGTIVVDGRGMTAYVFDHDTAGSGKSTCLGPCLALWPAIISDSATPDVSGVTGTVATIALADGRQQITLNGLPLYTFTADTKAGDVAGQGYGGIWWAVGADGTKIAATPPAAASPATSSSSGGSSGY